jgi:ABC-2 type transport system ATP-binding protein
VLRELRKMGKTLVVSSHILPELEGFCTRIVVMREGRVVFEGSPETGALRVGAGRRVFIRATGGSGDLKALLASDAAAEAVAEVEEGLLVALKDPSGDPGFVARRAVEAGWSIQELRIDRPGLQELFLNLTSPPGDGP